MAEQDLDRNEAATPYKLEKARERGSVAKSADVNAVCVLAAGAVACFAWAEAALHHLAQLMALAWRTPMAALASVDTASQFLIALMGNALQLLAPLLLGIVCAAVLGNIAQAGVVFSAQPLKPDFARINPAEGFKRIVSLRSLYEAGKGVIKLLLLGTVLALAFGAAVPRLQAMVNLPPAAYSHALVALAGGLLVKLLLALVLIAAVDWLFSQRHYARQMRMSRREIKDEFKHREGDPRIRARIKELRVKLLKRSQALRDVPKADVLITNPTRVAVALRYDHGAAPAPRVVAKGAGSLAAKMRNLAFRRGIPIVPSAALARGLYRDADAGEYIPEHWYPQVARILVWLHAARRARAAQNTGARA
jgi:flagellar biosynthetic protein FlhB